MNYDLSDVPFRALAPVMPEKVIEADAVTSGRERLEPGMLYTSGRIAFSCVRHDLGKPPRLKLKLYPAWFVNVAAAAGAGA